MNASTTEPITEDDIAHYLLHTPDFFERHASVLASVQLSSPHGGRAISLAERQIELLRDKVRTLELKQQQLLRHAQENQQIALKLQRWTSELLQVRRPEQWPARVADQLAALFGVPQVALRLWQLAPEHANAPFAQGVAPADRQLAGGLSGPRCGQGSEDAPLHWLPSGTVVGSWALLPLRLRSDGDAFGLILLADADPERFSTRMGTDFLQHMGELSAAALSRLLPEPSER